MDISNWGPPGACGDRPSQSEPRPTQRTGRDFPMSAPFAGRPAQPEGGPPPPPLDLTLQPGSPAPITPGPETRSPGAAPVPRCPLKSSKLAEPTPALPTSPLLSCGKHTRPSPTLSPPLPPAGPVPPHVGLRHPPPPTPRDLRGCATSRHTVRPRTTACPHALGRRGDERGDMALRGMISRQRTHVARFLLPEVPGAAQLRSQRVDGVLGLEEGRGVRVWGGRAAVGGMRGSWRRTVRMAARPCGRSYSRPSAPATVTR